MRGGNRIFLNTPTRLITQRTNETRVQPTALPGTAASTIYAGIDASGPSSPLFPARQPQRNGGGGRG